MAKKKPVKSVKKIPAKKPITTTLKDRISKIVDEYEDKEELKKQVFELVQRVLYPDQFCPNCNDRLFFSATGWSCPNCGYEKSATPQVAAQPISTISRPSETGKVPPQVEKMIKTATAAEPRRIVSPTKKGKSIRQLVDQMDTGGPSAPTTQDEAMVKRDKNVGREINWV